MSGSSCGRFSRACVTCPREHPFPTTLVFTVVASITRHQTQARDETLRDDSIGHSSESTVGLPNTSSVDNTRVAPGAEAANDATTEHANDAASSMGTVDGSVRLPVEHSAGPEEASYLMMKGGNIARVIPSNYSPAGDNFAPPAWCYN